MSVYSVVVDAISACCGLRRVRTCDAETAGQLGVERHLCGGMHG